MMMLNNFTIKIFNVLHFWKEKEMVFFFKWSFEHISLICPFVLHHYTLLLKKRFSFSFWEDSSVTNLLSFVIVMANILELNVLSIVIIFFFFYSFEHGYLIYGYHFFSRFEYELRQIHNIKPYEKLINLLFLYAIWEFQHSWLQISLRFW